MMFIVFLTGEVSWASRTVVFFTCSHSMNHFRHKEWAVMPREETGRFPLENAYLVAVADVESFCFQIEKHFCMWSLFYS